MSTFREHDRVIVNTGGADHKGVVVWTKHPPAPGLVKVQFENGTAQWMDPKHLRPVGGVIPELSGGANICSECDAEDEPHAPDCSIGREDEHEACSRCGMKTAIDAYGLCNGCHEETEPEADAGADESANVPCVKCGRRDVELHVDGRCGHCGPGDDLLARDKESR